MKYAFAIASLLASTAYATPMPQNPSSSWTAVPPASATVLLGNPSASPNPVAEPGFLKSLLNAESSIDRITQLTDEITKQKASIKYDFNPAANPKVTPGAGGAVFNANRVNYPAVAGLGVGAAALFFAPCGLNTPHTHPRASEFLTVVTDSNIQSGFVLENGFVAEQNTTLTQYQGMVFPMGSIHWQQNLDCYPAVAMAAFNSDDPGASSLAQNYLVNTNGEVVRASLGFPEQITADNFAQFKQKIPKPFAVDAEACYKRCGFTT